MTYAILWIDGRQRRILYTGTDEKQFRLLTWRNTTDIVNVREVVQLHGEMTVKTAILTVNGGM